MLEICASSARGGWQTRLVTRKGCRVFRGSGRSRANDPHEEPCAFWRRVSHSPGRCRSQRRRCDRSRRAIHARRLRSRGRQNPHGPSSSWRSCTAARPAVEEGRVRSSRNEARISGRSITATSHAGSVRLIHASALSGARAPWRNPAPTIALISRGATGAMRCAMRFDLNISCFEMLASDGAGPLTMAQPTRRSPRNLAILRRSVHRLNDRSPRSDRCQGGRLTGQRRSPSFHSCELSRTYCDRNRVDQAR